MDASGSQAGDGDASGYEAAWRDLIARYDMAIDLDTATLPWPDIESLGARPPGQAARDHAQQDHAQQDHAQQDHAQQDHAQQDHAQQDHAQQDHAQQDHAQQDHAQQDHAQQDQEQQDQVPRDSGTGPSGPGAGRVAEPGVGPEAGAGDDGSLTETETSAGEDRAGAADEETAAVRPGSGSGADRTRVIRHATAPAPRQPVEQGDQDQDEHYIPPPPPPLPRLDPAAKGAWTALFGGPAYLLAASIIGWIVPGWAALAAVAAFIGGFIVIVLRLGDGPSDPDNGAVL